MEKKTDRGRWVVKIASIPGLSHYTVPASRNKIAYCPSTRALKCDIKAHKCTLTDAAGAVCGGGCTDSL